jgi:hypothetical protein
MDKNTTGLLLFTMIQIWFKYFTKSKII